MAPHPPATASGSADGGLSAAQVFTALNEIRPAHAVLVEESPSNLSDLHKAWPITEPDTFYTFASGGLGWNLPASIGIALAERDAGHNRPVIAIIGDGSFEYSLQSIWNAAQLHLPMLIVIMRNGEYAILKSFAAVEQTPGVPASIFPAWTTCRSPRGTAATRSASTMWVRSSRPSPRRGPRMSPRSSRSRSLPKSPL